MQVSVGTYDPGWASAFSQICVSLFTAMEDVPVISIKHTKSTSIGGLAAKPIININIIVSPANIPRAMKPYRNGYTYNPESRGIDRYSFGYNRVQRARAQFGGGAAHGGRRRAEGGVLKRTYGGGAAESPGRAGCAAARPRAGGARAELGERKFESIGYCGEAENGILRKILVKGSLVLEVREEIARVSVMPPLE